MSPRDQRYGYDNRPDPPARFVPGGSPPSRVNVPPKDQEREGGDLGEKTAGRILSEDSRFKIDPLEALLTVTDEDGTNRVYLGHVGAGATDYGLEVYDASGDLILGATGLGLDLVDTPQIVDGAITADKIEVGAVIAEKIDVDDLAAINADLGTITAGLIQDAGATPTRGVLVSGTVPASWTTYLNLVDTASAFLEHDALTLAWDGSAAFSGALSAVTGTFDEITAGLLRNAADTHGFNLDATGAGALLYAPNVAINADGSIALGSHVTIDNAGNAEFSGELSAASGTFGGTLTADAVATGTLASLNADLGAITAGSIQSADYVAGSAGWRIDTAAAAEFNDVTIRGTLDGADGTFGGTLEAGTVATDSLASLNADLGAITAGTIDADLVTVTNLDTASLKADAVTAEKIAAFTMEVGKYIESSNYVAGSDGWRIDDDLAEFNDVTIRGTLDAVAGTFSSIIGGWLGNDQPLDATAAIRLTGATQIPATNYLDFTASGANPFLKHDALELLADGTATFSGTVTAESFTGAEPVFTGGKIWLTDHVYLESVEYADGSGIDLGSFTLHADGRDVIYYEDLGTTSVRLPRLTMDSELIVNRKLTLPGGEVSYGANDSAGTGYRYLRVPNS